MQPLIGFCLSLALMFACSGASAQEDPEAVYGKMHRALVAGKSDEVLSYATAAQKADLAKKSKQERDGVIQFMAGMLPKTYSITGKVIAPDGNSAVLQGTGPGPGGILGTAPMYLNANFMKEGGAWKVEKWGWSSDKPAPLAGAPAKASPIAIASSPPPPVMKAAAVPAKLEAAQQSPANRATSTAVRRSRANEDARECLDRPDSTAIVKCAERFL